MRFAYGVVLGTSHTTLGPYRPLPTSTIGRAHLHGSGSRAPLTHTHPPGRTRPRSPARSLLGRGARGRGTKNARREKNALNWHAAEARLLVDQIGDKVGPGVKNFFSSRIWPQTEEFGFRTLALTPCLSTYLLYPHTLSLLPSATDRNYVRPARRRHRPPGRESTRRRGGRARLDGACARLVWVVIRGSIGTSAAISTPWTTGRRHIIWH